jgi:hypothetical protein
MSTGNTPGPGAYSTEGFEALASAASGYEYNINIQTIILGCIERGADSFFSIQH